MPSGLLIYDANKSIFGTNHIKHIQIFISIIPAIASEDESLR